VTRAKIVITFIVAIGGAVTAVMAVLPYGWANVAGAAVGAAVAALSASLGTVATVQTRAAAKRVGRLAANSRYGKAAL
jgi:hypothetical protein